MSLKMLFAAAAMMAGTVGLAGSADAQRHDRGRHHYDQRGHRDDRGYDRNRHDRGHHWGRDRRAHCRIVYRHHRRIRVCR